MKTKFFLSLLLLTSLRYAQAMSQEESTELQNPLEEILKESKIALKESGEILDRIEEKLDASKKLRAIELPQFVGDKQVEAFREICNKKNMEEFPSAIMGWVQSTYNTKELLNQTDLKTEGPRLNGPTNVFGQIRSYIDFNKDRSIASFRGQYFKYDELPEQWSAFDKLDIYLKILPGILVLDPIDEWAKKYYSNNNAPSNNKTKATSFSAGAAASATICGIAWYLSKK